MIKLIRKFVHRIT